MSELKRCGKCGSALMGFMSCDECLSQTETLPKGWIPFEELCPKWSKEIRQDGTFIPVQKEKGLDISSHKCCIVGEAYGFDNGYLTGDYGKNKEKECRECVNLSGQIFGTDHYEGGNEICKLDRTVLEQFIQHFNEVHHK